MLEQESLQQLELGVVGVRDLCVLDESQVQQLVPRCVTPTYGELFPCLDVAHCKVNNLQVR
eukprot:scaffold101530_cov57-Phaeocystis_antarctica.AAC.2